MFILPGLRWVGGVEKKSSYIEQSMIDGLCGEMKSLPQDYSCGHLGIS